MDGAFPPHALARAGLDLPGRKGEYLRGPYRTWAAVHLRALREQRTGEIAGG